ncbi:MAG TPA: family 78 glycoside hydrolase catalytic domain [Terracidiphilus sp.]|nr:family 78 glycoside hydrolase catalytic domain [Terracidiphilus sp.]
MRHSAQGIAWGLMLSASIVIAQPQHVPGPEMLRVDDLTMPLGIDDPAPRFSWQLDDSARGAKQTAYEVWVAAQAPDETQNSRKIWDSGRKASDQSLNVKYEGPALKPCTGYFWWVKLWGADGKPYAEGKAGWFETGLMSQDAWKGQWIGYETTEEAAVRHAAAVWIASPDAHEVSAERSKEERVAYRASVNVTKPVRQATFYAAGEDTVSAWVNGTQILTEDPLPPYGQMPWKKFVAADVTGKLADGANSMAIETLRYEADPERAANEEAAPMIATLFVEYTDGTTQTFASDTSWKSAIHAAAGWERKGFDDSGWKAAAEWQQPAGARSTPLGHPWIPDSVKQLRHGFELRKQVKSARLYATALGEYEVFLNGKRVGNEVMAPGWTDYREHVTYQTFDVSALVKQGKNAVGALLAPGWYATPLEWFQQPNNYGDTPPALRAQLRVEYADGSIDWVTTTPEWQAKTSYIEHAELYDGETQDARLHEPGWDTAQFAASGWKQAIAIEPKEIRIEAQAFPPIRVERTLQAVSMKEPKPGVYVYDFGQNQAGVERVRVQGPAGTKIRLRFAEILNADGTLYTENLRTAKATDSFTLSGKGVEEFVPQFTYHGYRYAELTGVKTPPGKDAVVAEVFHTDARFTAEMKTGNEIVNKLLSNIEWGQRSNFMSVPTDCPQRDERLGWMADAQVFWRAASYNMDLTAFTRKFSADMRGTQIDTRYYGIYSPGTVRENAGYGAGWSDAGVIIPWTSWLQNGDTSVIEENWAAMEKYLAAIEDSNPDGLWKNSGIPFGDWLSPEGRTNQVLIATSSWAYDVTLMREMAHATGRSADEHRYAQLFEKIRDAFRKQFVHEDGFVAGADTGDSPFGERTKTGTEGVGDTQTGYVLALHMNLVPESMRAAVAQKLVAKIEANHGLLGTGFLGTPYLLEELTKTGHADMAYHLLLNTAYPSWGYLVEHGATTTWERWNGDQMKSDPSMNSYNHYAYGAVADWIYRYVAGVDATSLDAGFHTIVLHPQFDARLGSVEFSYPSPYGVIKSDWSIHGNTATWHVTIPANAAGWLGDDAAQGWTIQSVQKYDGDMESATGPNGEHGVRLAAGSYEFTAKPK